jgi:hypothetical protein
MIDSLEGEVGETNPMCDGTNVGKKETGEHVISGNPF